MITIFKIFERAINRDMKPIGDFLFDTFFKGPVRIEEYLSNNGKYYYVSMVFKDCRLNAAVENFKEFEKFIKPYCWRNYFFRPSMRSDFSYNKKGFSISFERDGYMRGNKTSRLFRPTGFVEAYRVVIQLGIKPENVEKIKNTPEFQEWYNNIKSRYDDFFIRKDMKKYNL